MLRGYFFYINCIDTLSVGVSLLDVKHAQITFNLFHFSRHLLPFIPDEEKGV